MKIEVIKSIIARDDFTLNIIFEDDFKGTLDIKPYLSHEAFKPLNDILEFKKIHNGGYFVEWQCGADLSADTLRQKMTPKKMQVA
jgi:hypothetical protein